MSAAMHILKAIAALCALVPGWLWAALLSAALVTQCVSGHQRERAQAALAELQRQQAEQQLAAEADARAREWSHQQTLNTQAQHAQQKLTQLQSELRAAGAAADGLRAAADAAAQRACPAAGVASAGTGEPDRSAARMLADVLAESDARAGTLAEHADRLAIAGAACERGYDAIAAPRGLD